MDGDVLIDPEASLQPRRQVVIVFPPLGGQRVNLGRQLCSTPHPRPPFPHHTDGLSSDLPLRRRTGTRMIESSARRFRRSTSTPRICSRFVWWRCSIQAPAMRPCTPR